MDVMMFAFRNAIANSRFANAGSATIGAAAAAVRAGWGGDDQGVKEHQGCGNDE